MRMSPDGAAIKKSIARICVKYVGSSIARKFFPCPQTKAKSYNLKSCRFLLCIKMPAANAS